MITQVGSDNVIRGTKKHRDNRGHAYWVGWIAHPGNICEHHHRNRETALLCARSV